MLLKLSYISHQSNFPRSASPCHHTSINFFGFISCHHYFSFLKAFYFCLFSKLIKVSLRLLTFGFLRVYSPSGSPAKSPLTAVSRFWFDNPMALLHTGGSASTPCPRPPTPRARGFLTSEGTTPPPGIPTRQGGLE